MPSRSLAFTTQPEPIWLFDLDNTLHNASAAIFAAIDSRMTASIAELLQLDVPQADDLRQHYWRLYGATLIGLINQHQICPHDFLHRSHDFDVPPLIQSETYLVRYLQSLPGTKYIVTNAPANYAQRVLRHLGLQSLFKRVFSIEDMFVQQRCKPKPSAAFMRQLLVSLQAPAEQCIFIDDTLRNLKAAHRVGMRTVHFSHPATPFSSAYAGRSAYVDLRVRSIKELAQRGYELPVCRLPSNEKSALGRGTLKH